ncbi:MAG: GNAT family N-acetyltransferase [Oscillospiraceae bacterium]|nr:GNAT family N-acetyltransferase [Oscillospiraceae bacterium]
MEPFVRAYGPADVARMTEIWNEVVRDGVAYPQTEPMTAEAAAAFFAEQSFTAVAEDKETGEVVGLYILHPNNVGRCGHIANASYAVGSQHRGKRVGRALVSHCLKKGGELGFRLLQFNAVVASNHSAIHLYESLGFVRIGTVPGGFLLPSGRYEDIVLFYHTL